MSGNKSSEKLCIYCDRAFTLKTNKLRHLALVHGVSEFGNRINNKILQRYKNYNQKKAPAAVSPPDTTCSNDDSDSNSREDYYESFLSEYDVINADEENETKDEANKEDAEEEEIDDDTVYKDVDGQVEPNFNMKMEEIMNSSMGEHEKFRHYALVLNQYWNGTNKNSGRFRIINTNGLSAIAEDLRRKVKTKRGIASASVARRHQLRSGMHSSSWIPY